MKTFFVLMLALCSVVFGHEGQKSHDHKNPRVLIFSKTSWYRHPQIPEVNGWLVRFFAKHGYDADVSESSKDINTKNLSNYKAVLLLSTTDIGISLDEKQRNAFKTWYQNGGGIVALHAAFVNHKHWDWFYELAGCDFDSDSEYVKTRVLVDPKFSGHDLAVGQKTSFWMDSEWLNWDKTVTGLEGVQVVLRADDTSFEPVREFFAKKGKKPMEVDHPVSWVRDWQGGKLFYSGIGHDVHSLEQDFSKKHLLAGLQWVLK